MATPETKPDPAEIVAYKGLDKDFRCRGFQYEVGQTYEAAGWDCDAINAPILNTARDALAAARAEC